MLRVYVNRKVVNGPWGGGNQWCRAFYEHAPSFDVEVVDDPRKSDVILIVGANRADNCIGFVDSLVLRHTHQKIVVRINENDARKATNGVDELMMSMLYNSDGTVFVSNWLKYSYFLPKWPLTASKKKFDDSIVILNGVDRCIFSPNENDKFKNGRVNIVTAHWSDNKLKGQDIVEWMDDFVGRNPLFKYTYVGRTKANLRNSTLVLPLNGKMLGQRLAKYDVCVNGTRFDPAPNSVIESVSCGLPTYVHKDGGGACELAGESHVFRSVEHLESILLSKNYEKNSVVFDDWKTSIKKYVDYLRKVHES